MYAIFQHEVCKVDPLSCKNKKQLDFSTKPFEARQRFHPKLSLINKKSVSNYESTQNIWTDKYLKCASVLRVKFQITLGLVLSFKI